MKTTTVLPTFLAFCAVVGMGSSFHLRPPLASSPRARTTATATRLAMAGKGFGASPSEPPKKQRQNPQEPTAAAAAPKPVVLNEGQKALEKMRREKAEQKDEELRRVKAMRETDKFVQETPEAAAIPEKVAARMGKRMLPFVGIPIFGTLGVFVLFWYLAVYRDVQFDTGLVALTSLGVLLVGLLGITYSVMSASWDTDREGSVLGVDEFRKNIDNLKGGLDRSKENLLLREKTARLSEDEIEAAIIDLDARDSAKEKREQTLSSKIKDELE